MENTKKYLTLDEQIALLKEKGLVISNEKEAKNKLKEVGYYKLINPYRFPFLVTIKDEAGNYTRNYVENIKFEYIYALFDFDQKLSAAVLEASTVAEVKFKSLISDLISKKYGIRETDYLRAENFLPDREKANSPNKENDLAFTKLKGCIENEIKKQLENKHPCIIWYQEHYQYYPFWVLTKILTFGTISRFYGKIKTADQTEIAREYRIQPAYLQSFIRHLSLIRNVCAHNDMLYRYQSESIMQKDTKKIYQDLHIEKNPETGRYRHGSTDFLATIIAFYYTLPGKAYNNLKTKILGLLNNLKKQIDRTEIYDEIVLSMGLVDGWEKILNRKR